MYYGYLISFYIFINFSSDLESKVFAYLVFPVAFIHLYILNFNLNIYYNRIINFLNKIVLIQGNRELIVLTYDII